MGIRRTVLWTAAALVAIGVALFSLWGRDNGTNVAVNSEPKPASQPMSMKAPAEPVERRSNEPDTSVVASEIDKPAVKALQVKAVKRPVSNFDNGSVAIKRTNVDRRDRGTVRSVRNSTEEAKKLPTLSHYDDDDDTSLRLADLFDDIGG